MKLLLVGPSRKISECELQHFEKWRAEGYKTLAYSTSLLYLAEIGFNPDYYSFLDPNTIGHCWSFLKEKTELTCNTELLVADMYKKDDLTKFDEYGFGITGFRVNPFFKEISTFNFFDNFKKVNRLEENLEVINLASPMKAYDFKEAFFLFKYLQGRNTDKLATFLFPAIINFFEDLQEIKLVGFGDLNLERVGLRGGTESYNSYLQSFYHAAPILAHNFKKHKINVDFHHDNIYKNLLDNECLRID